MQIGIVNRKNHPKIEKIRRKKFVKSMKKYTSDPEWITKRLGNMGRAPNGFEQRVTLFLQKNKLPFKFTGDFSFWVRPKGSKKSKNPDFVHLETWQKQAILAHGTYWHRDLKAVKQEIKFYRDSGWSVFIIWEDELLDKKMVQRIRRFAG